MSQQFSSAKLFNTEEVNTQDANTRGTDTDCLNTRLSEQLLPEYIGEKTAQQHIAILAQCYQQYFNQPLIADVAQQQLSVPLMSLWQADFVLLSHGVGDDPVFNFANLTAQRLFEMDYSTLTRLPSRKSAGPSTQQERDHLLAQVNSKGCIDDYRGIRVSASNQQFYIERAKVWNLTDEEGRYYGQAAMFKEWTMLK